MPYPPSQPAGSARRETRFAAVLVAFLSLIGGLAGPGWAGPPFVTDDPDTPERGGWEINVPVVIEREDRESEIEGPVLDVNYGLRDNVQLMVETGLLTVSPEHGATATGPGDITVGVKWRFCDAAGALPDLAIYPEVVLPTGDEGRGLGSGETGYALPLIASRGVGPWTVVASVGRFFQETDAGRDFWFHGLLVQREVSDRLELAAELYGSSPEEPDDRSVAAFNLGGTLALSATTNLLFSGGRGLSGGPDATFYLGLQVLVPGS